MVILAEIETTLRLGRSAGTDKFEDVKHMFETAHTFPMAANTVNRVSIERHLFRAPLVNQPVISGRCFPPSIRRLTLLVVLRR